MYVTLKTQGELGEDLFMEIYELFDEVFEVTKVLTFDEDGNKIETVATMDLLDDDPDYGALYEFDVARKIELNDGNQLVADLDAILKYDFELDAPIMKKEG